MKLEHLRLFIAVVEAGSFSGAAATLGCTQSRISHAIGELEKDLGAKLLHRSHAGSVPTALGHVALEKARRMLRLEQDLRGTTRDLRAIAARLRVACFRSVATHLLPHALEALGHEYPNIRVEIDDGCTDREEVTERVSTRAAELGIAQLPVANEFVVQSYVHDAYVVIVPTRLGLVAP
ncbi:MAG: LysR family transcriptional regulator, partial [Pseudomonadota bacterium]|nr:LysR family transcriptional regulator [Pseudomonadota bacterium]